MPNHDQIAENSGPLTAEYIAHTLADLVRIPSTNPGASEEDVARHIARSFDETPVEAALVESMPGRPSVGAILRGKGDGPRLILNGHMDTVPVDDESLWTGDPFEATVRDGYLYGRGACDMKAYMSYTDGWSIGSQSVAPFGLMLCKCAP